MLISIGWLVVGWLMISTISWSSSIGSWVTIGSRLVIGLGRNTSSQSWDEEAQPGLQFKIVNIFYVMDIC